MTARFAILAMLSLAGTASAVDPPTDRQRGDAVIRARNILKKYCSECHKPGGPGFDILDHTALTGKHPVAFVDTKLGSRSQIIEFIEDGSMPPAGKPRPDAAELRSLKEWITGAGAPSFPKSFDAAYVLATVQADWPSQKPPANYRYISFAHLVQDSTKGLESEEKRLKTALAAATTRTVELVPVDPAGTVYRLDIEKAGWAKPDLFENTKSTGNAHELRAWDLVLLENPFPLTDAKTDTLVPKTRAVPPVPYLRGDWLTMALESPLADDLKSLVELDAQDPTQGPIPRMFQGKGDPGGPAPITSWYRTKPAEPFKVEFTINGGTNPVLAPNMELEIEVRSGIDAQFRLIRVMDDGFSSIVPVAGGDILKKDTPHTVRPSKGSFKTDNKPEHFLLIVSPTDNPIPVPTFVESVHLPAGNGLAPVRRILFDTKPAFDATKAVRRVITVQVKK